jgi:hypothetical protein
MAQFKKGVSGNPKGRPKGTGSRQHAHKQKAHEDAVFARLQLALVELDRWHAQRSKLIEEYVLGAGRFPLD